MAYQKLVVSRADPHAAIETFLLLPDRSKRNDIEGLFGCFSIVDDETDSAFAPPVVTFSGDADSLIRKNFMTLVEIGGLVEEQLPEIEEAVPCFLDSILRMILGGLAISIRKDKSTPSFHPASRVCMTCRRTSETLKPEFATDVVGRLRYPLHFIDFETAQSAVPFSRGMRPYEKVLFQWSCHTMPGPAAPLEHSEWLHDDQTDPNVVFGKTLMDCLGDTGTLMTWSAYENTQLAYLFRYLGDHDIDEPGLSEWLERTAKIDGEGGERIRELLQAHDLYQIDQNGKIIDPYSLLPAIRSFNLADEPENSERVAEGTGAMIAYQKMIFGGLDFDERRLYREALLRYCKLDTLAMVLIWEYWSRWAGFKDH